MKTRIEEAAQTIDDLYTTNVVTGDDRVATVANTIRQAATPLTKLTTTVKTVMDFLSNPNRDGDACGRLETLEGMVGKLASVLVELESIVEHQGIWLAKLDYTVEALEREHHQGQKIPDQIG